MRPLNPRFPANILRLPRAIARPLCVAAPLAGVLASCASHGTSPDPETTQQPLSGLEGTFEFAIDAPWRMNPRWTGLPPVVNAKGGLPTPDQVLTYDAIPLQVSIHDSDRTGDEHGMPSSAVTAPALGAVTMGQAGIQRGASRVGKVCKLTVVEGSGPYPDRTEIPIAAFDEVERSRGAWTYPSQPGGPPREACTRLGPQNCAGLAYIGETSEWHGLAHYRPHATVAPGTDVVLELRLKLTRTENGDCEATNPIYYYTITNFVRVHYGEAPLPVFSSEWAYGDLHYHSQGTDNEGESGYNYRGVSHAMRAIGLDFLWATEHASSSEQFMDVDIQVGGRRVDGIDVYAQGGVLRDMDANRFQTLRAVVAQTNRESTIRHGSAAPQIFLGGEVDVIPEVRGSRGVPETTVAYGANKVHPISHLCGGWNTAINSCSSNCPYGITRCCDFDVIDTHSCDPTDLLVKDTPAFGNYPGASDSFLVKDVQGLNEILFGREHMVYLPDPDRADAFVASQTGRYGGAQRRLVIDRTDGTRTFRGMLPEVEEKQGSVFIAHHNNAPYGSQGPDGIPWSEDMLVQALASRAVLGLEFWNENVRRSAPVVKASRYFVPGLTDPPRYPGTWFEDGYQRDSSALGNDVQLVDQERKGLVQWGPDGHFDLGPYDRWYAGAGTGVESMLTDGAVTWDKLNARGITPWYTRTFSWLPAGQPRRMFVAAGSDAHGDFNYRREGYATGTSSITDTALGSPRNLVFVGAPASTAVQGLPPVFGAGQVLAALRAGHFAATDGPALRIAVDLNGNGVIDPSDGQMGDVVDIMRRANVPILVEWISTPEFGAVNRIELTVGVWAEGTTTRLYTGGDGLLGTTAVQGTAYSQGGYGYVQDARGYWRFDLIHPPTPDPLPIFDRVLASSIPEPRPMRGTKAFSLPLAALHATAGGPKPTRLFVRATAMTTPKQTNCNVADGAEGRCLRRYGLSNPVWVRDTTIIAPFEPPVVLGASKP